MHWISQQTEGGFGVHELFGWVSTGSEMRALAALSLSSTMRSETRQSSELATLPTKAISNEEPKEIELHRNEVKASFKKSKCRSTLRKTIPRRTKSWCWHTVHSKLL